MSHTLLRLCAASFIAALVLIGAPAVAHVTVSSPDASPGGWGKIVFRVPNESDTATNTAVTVNFPTDKPFAHLNVQPKAGWEASVETVKEAVKSITWKATGGGIAPGQFDEFAVAGGPFPDATEISFSAIQSYSDGTTVAWDEKQAGDKEPENPAPTLALVAEDHHDGEDEGDDDKGGADWAARGVAIAGLAVGGFALVGARRRAS